MTIERAREILGEDIAHLTDEQVAQMNNETSQFASTLLRFYLTHPKTHRLTKDNFQCKYKYGRD